MTKILSGVVLSASGPNPGLSSGITYTVRVDLEGRTVDVPGVVPVDGRWPAPYVVVAAAVGTVVEIHDLGGEWRFMFHGAEKPDYYECNP